jgi:hypothetical protein
LRRLVVAGHNRPVEQLTAVLWFVLSLGPELVLFRLHRRAPRSLSRWAFVPVRTLRVRARQKRVTQVADGYRGTERVESWHGGPLAGPAELRGPGGVVVWIDEDGARATVSGPPTVFRITLGLSVEVDGDHLSLLGRRFPSPLPYFLLGPFSFLPAWPAGLLSPSMIAWLLVSTFFAVVGSWIAWNTFEDRLAPSVARREAVLREAQALISRHLAEVTRREHNQLDHAP